MAEIDTNPGVQRTFGGLELQRADRNQEAQNNRARPPEEENEEGSRIGGNSEDEDAIRPNRVNDIPSPTEVQRARLAEEEAVRQAEPVIDPPPQLDLERPLEPEENVENAVQRGSGNLIQEEPEGPGQGNVSRLDDNPGALRPSNLGTGPALQASRNQRNVLSSNEDPEPPPPVEEVESGPAVSRTDFDSPSPQGGPVGGNETQSVGSNRTENIGGDQPPPRPQGVEREEEENPQSADNAPANVQTERGQNIDRLI